VTVATLANHIPVMTREVLAGLNVRPGGRYIDATLGGGGHALAILEAAQPGGTLLGIDRDADALDAARRKLERFGDDVQFARGDFADIASICEQFSYAPVHGVLLDLGLSSLQLEDAGRGFSFQSEGPLDMRFDQRQELTAAEIVNEYSEKELANVISEFGEEPMARRVAKRIVAERPLRTTTELARVVEEAVGGRVRRQSHPATRTFQALRIAVNRDLLSLAAALPQAYGLLGDHGRLVVISYHSLEDRLVKELFRKESRDCICPPKQPVCTCGHKAALREISRSAVKPSPEEVAANPRSRSARLRVAERLPAAG
jgi:16S rRNA (cytosine1402-N4)-methyltransferase